MSVTRIGHYHFFYTGPLGNWHRARYTDPRTGIVFETSEQGFMWDKAHFFRDEEMMKAIAAEANPRKAKDLGRLIKGYDDKAWECVRSGYMIYANYLKFSQNADKAKYLLDTGNETLVEASPVDKIWGIGLGADTDPAILGDRKQWQGRNLLGLCLMKVRSMLNENNIS